VDSSLNDDSVGSHLQQLAVNADPQSVVRMAHYKGTIVVVKLLSSKGTTFTRMDELEMTAVSFVANAITVTIVAIVVVSSSSISSSSGGGGGGGGM